MKLWLIVLIVLIVLLVVAYLGMGYVIFDKLGNIKGSCDEHLANRPDNFALHPDWPADFDVTPYYMSPYEVVRFPSRDPGFEVAGWWMPRDPDAPAVILVDGLGGCKNRPAVRRQDALAQRVQRADDRPARYRRLHPGRWPLDPTGNEEHRDVLGAWDWLVSEKGFDPSRIGLFANSLGGANANYAFAAEPRIAALFLQSTFGNLQQIISAELTRNNYPTFLAPGALLMGSILTGTNLFARSPVEAIRQAAGRPVYIVHTRADTRIAVSQSEQLAAAAQAAGVNVTTWFPDNGEHVQTPAAYPDEFEQRMVGFFRNALGQ